MPGRQLVIVLGGLGRRLGAADRVNFGVGKLFHGKRLTISLHKALKLIYQRIHQPVPPRVDTGPYDPCTIWNGRNISCRHPCQLVCA